MKTPKIVGVIFSLLGICMLIGDLFAYKSTSDFINNSEKTEGVVTELKRVTNNLYNSASYETLYAPVVKYKTPGGVEREFVSSTSSYPAAYSAGDKVEVIYDKRIPASAEINSFFSIWLVVFILTLLGSVFSIIGTLLLRIKEENFRG
ncbi:MAG TPA: DUF3592 domain-containing protein [Candidatus Wallbacteria bacterium]|nr:DUF3592 domain-containing protein [Candidatus Wallbacteria bacterium]